MSEIDTGGPAFPGPGGYYGNPATGMTLRDHFAAQALDGMLAHSTRYKPLPGAPANWHDAISQEAYALADAMLAARKAKP